MIELHNLPIGMKSNETVCRVTKRLMGSSKSINFPA